MRERNLLNKDDVEKEANKFKMFAFSKSMIQISVGVILANSFQKLIAAATGGIIMPCINGLLPMAEGGWRTATWKITQNVTIEIGSLLGSFVDFLLTALILYVLYVKIAKPLLYPDDPDDDDKKPVQQPTTVPIYPPEL